MDNEYLPGMRLGQSRASFEFINKLGQSGAVRKFVDESYAIRFERQFLKHCEANNRSLGDIKVPSILSSFENNGYEMSIAPGVSLGDFLVRASNEEVEAVSNSICSLLNLLLSEAVSNLDVEKDLISKIDSLQKMIYSMHERDPFIQLLSYLRKSIHSMKSLSGWNHGDFSFENILVSSDLEVWTIDFLDSPAETPLIDLGRIWLDAHYGWWGFGFEETANSRLNSKLLAQKIGKLATEKNLSLETLDTFAALAILRVVPYTTSPLRISYLKWSAWQILEARQ